MKKIPTAEEYVLNEYELTDINKVYADPAHIVFMMKEFAKLHVKAALKSASKKAKIQDYVGKSSEIYFCVNEESIINSYPLDKIK